MWRISTIDDSGDPLADAGTAADAPTARAPREWGGAVTQRLVTDLPASKPLSPPKRAPGAIEADVRAFRRREDRHRYDLFRQLKVPRGLVRQS